MEDDNILGTWTITGTKGLGLSCFSVVGQIELREDLIL